MLINAEVYESKRIVLKMNGALMANREDTYYSSNSRNSLTWITMGPHALNKNRKPDQTKT